MTQHQHQHMTLQQLLDQLAALGASLEADPAGSSDRLIVTEGADPIPAALLQQLRQHKPAILAWLRSQEHQKHQEHQEQLQLLHARGLRTVQHQKGQPGILFDQATGWYLIKGTRLIAGPFPTQPDAVNAGLQRGTQQHQDQQEATPAPAAPATAPAAAEEATARAAVDPVWTPPRWLMDPDRAAATGIVCGSRLYVWRSADPRTVGGGLLGDPRHVVDLTAPLEDGNSNATPGGAQPGDSLAALADLMRALHLRAVWLIPAQGSRPSAADCPIVRQWGRTDLAQLRAATASRWLWHEISAKGPAGNSALLGGLGFRAADQEGNATGARRCLYAPWVQDGWAIADDLADLPAEEPAARARIVASALALAEWALGVQLWYSPAHSGLTLLRDTLQQWAVRGIALDPLPEAWQDFLRAVRASDVRWARSVPQQEMDAAAAALEAAGYPRPPADMAALHVYDRNSSYVSSARAVPVGIPTPTAEYVPGCIGVYRVNATAPAGWDPRTPGPVRCGEIGAAGTYPLRVRDSWAWSPYLQLALQQGWRVDVLEGYSWPKQQRHELLRQWQTVVWEARRNLEGYRAQGAGGASGGAVGLAATLAVHLVKRLGVATIGRLMPREGHAVMTTADALALGYPVEWELTDERGQLTGLANVTAPLGRQDLVHPEWWSPIIAGAGERLLTPICREAPTSTAAAYIDSLYSLVPLPALAGDPLKTGGYRHNHTVLVPRAVLEAGTFTDIVSAAAHGPELPVLPEGLGR